MFQNTINEIRTAFARNGLIFHRSCTPYLPYIAAKIIKITWYNMSNIPINPINLKYLK
jgi:hypothetical protein